MAGRLSTALRNAMAGAKVELITNGLFTDDASSWTAATATVARVATGGTANGPCLQVGTLAGYAHQQITGLRSGQVYKLTVWYDGTNNAAGGGYPRISIGTAAGNRAYHDSGASALTAETLTKYEAWFRVPDGVTSCYINLECTGTGNQLFDSVSFSCDSRSIQDCLNGAEVRFYTGTQPASPDDTVSGYTLLVTVKNNKTTGVTWKDAVAGVLGKTVGEVWQGDGVADGTVGWFRVCLSGDPGTADASYVWPRIDGSVATSGGQLNFPSLSFATAATQTVSDITPTVKMQA